MPIATVIKKTERLDLKTLPDAYVVVRRMTYGEKMDRMERLGKMRILSNKVDKDAVGELNMMKADVQIWEFAHLVIEHNLEHQDIEDGPVRPLNFKNPADVSNLQSRVGEEIAAFMDKLNNFEEDEDVKNSSSGSEPESSSSDPANATSEKLSA